MAKTPEKVVKDKVVAVLKMEEVYYFFPATHGYGRSGVPDIIACVNGHFLGIECKANGGKPTALQTREIERIRACGGAAIVVDETNWHRVSDVVRELKTTVIIDKEWGA
jgi:Holliday junction resolvase